LEAGGATDVTSLDIAKAIQSGGLLTDGDRKVFEDAQKEGVTPLEKIADQQLTATRSILDLLRTGVVSTLEMIYGLMPGSPGADSLRRKQKREESARKLRAAGFDSLTDDEKKTLGVYDEGLFGFGARGWDADTVSLFNMNDSDKYAKVMEYLAKKEKGEADKRSDDVVDGLDELGQSIVDGFELDARAGLARLLPTGTNVGDLTAAEAAKMLKAGGVSPEERAAFIKAFGIESEGMLNDFMYRGGKIMSINTSDDFYGAKPGGAIDKALRGGAGGVTINNLTINESGNPQKTLEMVKQAIRAAKYA